jgi:phage repressor protein C with HTH and peptisase S24 domain
MSVKGDIQKIIDHTGWTQERLAQEIGVTQPTVNRWLAGADPRGETRDRINKLLARVERDPNHDSTLDDSSAFVLVPVPVVGKAGAGPNGEVIFDAEESAFETITAVFSEPPVSPKAVEVAGDSMRGIAYDGWMVVYDDEQKAPAEDLIDELCVVGLEDGRVLVKILVPGRSGFWNLESLNAATMRDVTVRWAAPVLNIIPRKAARRMLRLPAERLTNAG